MSEANGCNTLENTATHTATHTATEYYLVYE